MKPNSNWSRWIYTSLVRHFDDYKENVDFFVEGQTRPTRITDFAELRIDGPYYNELSHALWDINVVVAILIQVVRNDNDLYKIQKYSGIFESAFTLDIPVFKYGDKEDVDTGEQLLCLSLSPRLNERIRITQYGQIQAATNVAQASIEARYQRKFYTPQGT